MTYLPLTKAAQTNDPFITGPAVNAPVSAPQQVMDRGHAASIRPGSGAKNTNVRQTTSERAPGHNAAAAVTTKNVKPGAPGAFKGAESIAGALLPEIPAVPYQAVTHPVAVSKGLFHDAVHHLKAPEPTVPPMNPVQGDSL